MRNLCSSGRFTAPLSKHVGAVHEFGEEAISFQRRAAFARAGRNSFALVTLNLRHSDETLLLFDRWSSILLWR
jgi:hypothetical protein